MIKKIFKENLPLSIQAPLGRMVRLLKPRPIVADFKRQLSKTEANDINFRRIHFNKAKELWNTEKKEEAWQEVLYSLSGADFDKETVAYALEIIFNYKRYNEAVKLIHNYQEATKDRSSFRALLDQALEFQKTGQLTAGHLEKRCKELDILNAHTNGILSDQQHLDACMQWFKQALAASSDDGVPAIYDLVKRQWNPSYPETTGYIIPTFIAYAKLAKDRFFLDAAKKMGDWEIRISLPNGGVGEPVGIYIPHPRVFNVGQIIFGWLALYKETKDRKYLDALKKAGDFLVLNLEPDGRWERNTFSGAVTYHSRVVWALLELYAVSGNKVYQEAAHRALDWIMRQALKNGWFESNGFNPRYSCTHLIAYNYVGLLKIYNLRNAGIDYQPMMDILKIGARQLMGIYHGAKAKGSRFGFSDGYDKNWNSVGDYTCMTGIAQISYFLNCFGQLTGDRQCTHAADAILTDLKKWHMIDNISDKNIYGSLLGAFPVRGDYAPYLIPNWGVKFLADVFLQRLMKEEDLYCIS